MEVFALVGASGTGKSYRASLLAHQLEIDVIVDDGLLVRDGKIVAGQSAKREPTRVGAIRRALFLDEEQARTARAHLAEIAPRRVLILGTSRRMVGKIAEQLDLAPITRFIPIEEIASPLEIRRAKRIRLEQGKHVIPAPTLEVRRRFSGFAIDPLRFFLRGRERARDVVIEKSVVRPTFSGLGRFVIEDTVVASIAGHACTRVDGVRSVLRAQVATTPDGVNIDLDVAVVYRTPIMDALRSAQRHVREAVEHMTALNVLAVNIAAKRLVMD